MSRISKAIVPHNVAVGKCVVEPRMIDVSAFFKLERNFEQYDETLKFPDRLRSLSAEHITVAFIESASGRQMVIDGHRRRFAWLNKWMTRPTFLIAIVYKVSDADFESEAIRLFRTYDSKEALKTNEHVMQGAMNALGLDLKTEWIVQGKYTGLMNLAITAIPAIPKKADKKTRVEFFRHQLELFDSIDPIQNLFPMGWGAAALLFLLKYDKAALPFLRDYNRGINCVSNSKLGANANFLLTEFLRTEKLTKSMAGGSNNKRQMALALAYMEKGLSPNTFYRKGKLPRPVDLSAFVASI